MLSAARLPQVRAEACISLQASWEQVNSSNCPNHVRRTKSSIKKRIIVRRTVRSMFGEQTFAQLRTGLRWTHTNHAWRECFWRRFSLYILLHMTAVSVEHYGWGVNTCDFINVYSYTRTPMTGFSSKVVIDVVNGACRLFEQHASPLNHTEPSIHSSASLSIHPTLSSATPNCLARNAQGKTNT